MIADFIDHIQRFVATLRAAGLTLGTGALPDAVRAVTLVGIARRDDLKAALAAVLVTRPSELPLFEQAFAVYFGRPELLDRLADDDLPSLLDTPRDEPPDAGARRLLEALSAARPPTRDDESADPAGAPSASADEALSQKDFAQMSRDEFDTARRMIAALRLSLPKQTQRRYGPPGPRGRLDWRALMADAPRNDGEIVRLICRSRRRRPLPLVLLIDISGSMSAYSRAFVTFAHALTREFDRVETFLFGTRLSHVTRELRTRDIDDVLRSVSRAVSDWDGGTRISESIATFNRDWARRVLSRRSAVVLFSDGLERDPGPALSGAMERLSLNAWRLLWLNPLLGFAEFRPRALGIRRMLPHVDAFLPAHNVDSLAGLGDAFATADWHTRNPRWPRRRRSAMLTPVLARTSEL